MRKKQSEGKGILEVRSWRDIKQSAGRELSTRLARGRRLASILRKGTITLVAAGVIAGIGFGGISIFSKGIDVVVAGPSESVRSVKFGSDGVLNSEWADRLVRIKSETGIMNVDIYEIKGRLEDFRQIKSAVVSRSFPDELHIVVKERKPFLRVRVQGENLDHEDLLVARDGVVYKGWNYPPATIDSIPFVGGVRFLRDQNSTLRVPGLERIAELLDLTRKQYPELFARWLVVSCDDYLGEESSFKGTIKIQGADVREMIFSPEDFPAQLERLNRILKRAREWDIRSLKRVDLSMGDQVIVQFYPKLNPGV